VGSAAGWKRKWRLLLLALDFGAQLLPCAGDGKALFVKKSLDTQHTLDVLVTIHPLPCTALDGLQLGELGFPETQNVCRQLAKAGNFADTEIEFFRNDDVGCLAVLRVGFVPWAHGWMISFPPSLLARPGARDNPYFSRARKKPLKSCLSRGRSKPVIRANFSSRRLVFLFLLCLFLCWHEVSSVNDFPLQRSVTRAQHLPTSPNCLHGHA